MADIVFAFNDNLLQHVKGTSPKDTAKKKEVLKRDFIGQELHKCSLKQADGTTTLVYRIGYTNRIITDDEFNQYINAGLLSPRVKQPIVDSAVKHIAHQIVGNTTEIPVQQPNLQYNVERPTKPLEIESKPKLNRKVHQPVKKAAEPVINKVEQTIAAQVMQKEPVAVPVPAPAAKASTPEPVQTDFAMQANQDVKNSTSYILQQTGMFQALQDTTLFDEPCRQFQFEPETKSSNGVVAKIKGIFHRNEK